MAKAITARSHTPHPLQTENTPTVLPRPLAGAVSLATRSGSLWVRLGTGLGKLAIDGARVTTITGLELGRTVVERVLFKAGDDVVSHSIGPLGRKEAEGILARSIASLHATITGISFAAAAGFHIGTASLNAASDLSKHLLTTLDSIFGSTDSSRAIASIITLVRREFENPATGQPGERVGLMDLILGICSLALLQRWCRDRLTVEADQNNHMDVVWDVVILDNGRRADVAHSDESGKPKQIEAGDTVPAKESSSMFTPEGGETLRSLQHTTGHDNGDDEWFEVSLRQSIMSSLPPNATVSINTETTTTKTITVEIVGAQPPKLSPPPGVELIEESHQPGFVLSDDDGDDGTEDQSGAPQRFHAVFRTTHSSSNETDISAKPHLLLAPGSGQRNLAIETDNDGDKNVLESTQAHSTPLPRPSLEVSGDSSRSRTARDSDQFEHAEESPAKVQANTKRTRQSSRESQKPSNPTERPQAKKSNSKTKTLLSKKPKTESASDSTGAADKRGTLRDALKRGSQATISGIFSKDSSSPKATSPREAPTKPPWGAGSGKQTTATNRRTPVSGPDRSSSMVPARAAPRPPSRSNVFDLTYPEPRTSNDLSRVSSRASLFEVHTRRRDSIVSQTDTYSTYSTDNSRAPSPTHTRTQSRAQLMRARSQQNVHIPIPTSPTSVRQTMLNAGPPSPIGHHRRQKSYEASLYTLKTNTSQTSLIIAPRGRSAYDAEDSLNTLSRTGTLPGLFPHHHFIRNVTRFIRFSSASYGSSFLRLMGIVSSDIPMPPKDEANDGTEEDKRVPGNHYEHHSFSTHTSLPPSTILLSSFYDPNGGSDSEGNTGTHVPLVHFVSLDHASRAVVLSCRGTLGFEDVLTDLSCEYDDFIWRGRAYRVHKGMLASARRLLSGVGSKVLPTLAAALEEFPEYGLVLTGHSLGGGVVALLAIMLSQPNNSFDPLNESTTAADTVTTAFVTTSPAAYLPSKMIGSSADAGTAALPVSLPAGRPIHVYAYGPPATLSPSLRKATRGLITTIVNGLDIVPSLSLGTLHDLQAVALAFKTDTSGASTRLKERVKQQIRDGLWRAWYKGDAAAMRNLSEDTDEDIWAWATLKTLRAAMVSEKLVPPGEVFVVESSRVLQRDAFTSESLSRVNTGLTGSRSGLGRPATRVVVKYVREVENVFGRIRFGGGMLGDHSVGRYEIALRALGSGVLGNQR